MITLLVCLLRKHKHRMWLLFALVALLLWISLAQALGEAPRMKTVLYGASYYHEYMPYDRLEKDIELMQKAGITVVRLGESTWTSWEPRDGEFEFAWMQRILDRLHGAGIQVILGTHPPTPFLPGYIVNTRRSWSRGWVVRFCNEYSTVRWTKAPGPLQKACGFTYQEFSNLKQELPLKGDPFQAGDQNRVSVWAEFLVPDSATGLAFYDHPFFGKYPAITRNEYGKGTVTYEGTVFSDKLQERVIADILKRAGLYGPDQVLPGSVRYKAGIGNGGKPIRYYLNYSDQVRTFTYPHEYGTELLTQKPIAKLQTLTLPRGVVIVEEK